MKKTKRFIACITAVFLVLYSPFVILASEPCAGRQLAESGELFRDAISLLVDGESYGGDIFLISNTAYVSLREFATFADNAYVEWDGNSSVAYVYTHSLTLSVAADSYYIEANGRALPCEYGSFVKDGRMYVPLRPFSRALGYECYYDDDTDTIFLSRTRSAIVPADNCYDADELYWLSRIIFAEAGAEPFDGKLAVGTVIMNRVASDEFPSSVIDVIFDTENGVQFSPVKNGSIYSEPDADCILAAKLTLEGVRVAGDSLYFLNTELAESKWIVNNCEYIMTIGSHDFYT